jgi:hypothetical protein
VKTPPWQREQPAYTPPPSQEQDALRRIGGMDQRLAGASIAWSLTHSARPDLLVDAFKEARRG